MSENPVGSRFWSSPFSMMREFDVIQREMFQYEWHSATTATNLKILEFFKFIQKERLRDL